MGTLLSNFVRAKISVHELCHHTLVSPILVNALNAVNQQQITLLTHEELEEIEEQSPPENPSSLDERLLESPAERAFEQQQPVAESAASANPAERPSIPYLNYYYDATDMQDLLSCRLQSLPTHQQVVCLEVVFFRKHNEPLRTQQPDLANVIHKWLTSPTSSQQQVTTVIPIATKYNQWIALLITWQHRTIQRLFFFDSANDKNNTSYYTHHLTDILARTKLLNNVPICNAQTEWKHLLTQTRIAASGAYLIENIYGACKRQFWDPNTNEKTLRERHLQLLPAEQRQAFINKQTRAWQQDQNNRSSTSTANNYQPRLFQPLGRAQTNLQNPDVGITPK